MVSTDDQTKNVPASHAYKAIGILLFIVIIVIVGWLVLANSADNKDSTGQPPTAGSQTNSSPDRVKQSQGNTGDTVPSPNGTGTGSSNHSILGQ